MGIWILPHSISAYCDTILIIWIKSKCISLVLKVFESTAIYSIPNVIFGHCPKPTPTTNFSLKYLKYLKTSSSILELLYLGNRYSCNLHTSDSRHRFPFLLDWYDFHYKPVFHISWTPCTRSQLSILQLSPCCLQCCCDHNLQCKLCNTSFDFILSIGQFLLKNIS